MSKNSTIIIEMTRKDALELGLLACECGHPINNHFTNVSPESFWPCAHCKCTAYREIARRGRLVKKP